MNSSKVNINYYFYFIIFSLYSMNSYSYLLEELTVPEGFEISIFASDLDSPRQLTETKDGAIIVGSKKGTKVLDIAKSLLDYGHHAPTIYFPINIPEALMMEPTEF